MITLESSHEPSNIPQPLLESMLDRAAEKGAKRALADVGIGGKEAGEDIRELRSLLSALQMAKRTMWQTIIRMITIGFILSLMAGAAIKLRIVGGE